MSSPFGDSTPIDFREDIHDAITGTIITATVEFRGTVFNSNAASDIAFKTSGGTQAKVAHRDNVVNYLSFYGGATSVYPQINAFGNDTNVGIAFYGKTGGYFLFDPGGGVGFRINNTALAVNYVNTAGSVAGGGTGLWATGNDSNVGMGISCKGSAGVGIYTDTWGVLGFSISHTASGVNYLQAQPSVTGNSAVITAQGADTNVSMWVSTKAAGPIKMAPGGLEALNVLRTASSVNYFTVQGAVASSAPAISLAGTDTDIDMALSPKGAGVVRFGTHTALGAEVLSGYITIKDSGGTTRKLAVIS